MLPPAQFSHPLAVAGLTCVAILCLVYLRESPHGEDLHVYSSPALSQQPGGVGFVIKRTWESEQGPFSTGPHGESVEDEAVVAETEVSTIDGDERLRIPGPGNPLPPLAVSVLGGSAVAAPVPGLPAASTASGDLFSSVISILAGAPAPAPTSPGGNGAALGGLLSVLSQVSPLSAAASNTRLPVVPTGSAGLLPAIDVLGGVAAALDDVLGSSEDNDSLGGGLLGQLSANIVAPIASIAADPASILANPSAALDNLQSQVSSVLDSLPSAVAAGVQLTSNIGGQIADALDATTEVLDSVPGVAAGVADQVGSLLNAAPNLATGLPAVALSAVNQIESVLAAAPDLVGDPTGTLGGLKQELSSAIVNAVPELTSLAAAVGGHVVDVLPLVLQGPVQGVLSSLQNDVSGPLCQVSDVVGGTAIIFNVPCGSVNPVTSEPGAMTATTPAAASASITVGATLPSISTLASSSSRPPLTSVLLSLGSSLTSAGIIDASGVDPAASSALSGLSSLFSEISGLSLTATTSLSTQLTPLTVPLSPSASSDQVAKTTIYHIQTITALITSTEVQISTVTQCSVDLSSGALEGSLSAPPSPDTSVASSVPGADTQGPCPDHGFTCDDCLDGWFCPPVQTPAWPAPCGYGWPCYQCESGWFCVPLPGDTETRTLFADTPTSPVVIPTSPPATRGYQYAGCYADDSTRVLGEAEMLDVRGGMTNEGCVKFCQRQGLTLAGTEDGAQCFCGNVLIGSLSLPPGRCNVPCTGDLSNSTACGGPWALSVWAPDGTARQEPKPASLPQVVGYYGFDGERDSPASEETATAGDLTSATATGKPLHPNSSDFSLGLGDLMPDNFTMANSQTGVTDEPGAARGGKEWVDPGPHVAMSPKKRSWGPRGRARWT